jgi:hypothetical protein
MATMGFVDRGMVRVVSGGWFTVEVSLEARVPSFPARLLFGVE